jgi:dTDP-4-amino-4,6-dideoxygalactose transaminase
MKKIVFNRASFVGKELKFISEAIQNAHISGNGPFTERAEMLLEEILDHPSKVLLTTSCTHALEMAAILLDLKPGDEVIVPSYTFVTSALAFHMHGAKIVFADIKPETLNLDEKLLQKLVTEKTRAIIPVHYGGVSCEMDQIMDIAAKNNIIVIEDNAHGLFGKYKGKNLGTLGHMATQSFHETKNVSCGEGGALVINDTSYIERAEIIREKGTDRSKFFRGQIDKYSWMDRGSSYVMSDILAAYLCAQLLESEMIQEKRSERWEFYNSNLKGWTKENSVDLPSVPEYCEHPSHLFYLLMPSESTRNALINFLKENDIQAVFHYLPLNSSPMAKKIGSNEREMPVTENVSKRLLRLPLYLDLDMKEMSYIVEKIKEFKI